MTEPALTDAPGGAAAPVVERDPGSYRDPGGFIYRRDGVLYRQIGPASIDDWSAFVASGLAERLIASGRLIGHQDAPLTVAATADARAVIAPEPIEFISYPYEWTFGELKDAALLTLDCQLAALEAGWTLKDASAYNVQFRDGKPVMIDSLSFEPHEDGSPWVAYRQFCEHFLAPLTLMARRDVRLAALLRADPDGVPLDLAKGLLPWRTRLNFGLLSHLHLHANAQVRHAADDDDGRVRPARPDQSLEARRAHRQPAQHRGRARLEAGRHGVVGLRRQHLLQRPRHAGQGAPGRGVRPPGAGRPGLGPRAPTPGATAGSRPRPASASSRSTSTPRPPSATTARSGARGGATSCP